MEKQMWLLYAILAGLCWGTYVPFVQQGIAGLTTSDGRPQALGSFLCVGVAYFLIAVLFPVGMFVSGEAQPRWNTYGITFATLAGVAGALGALCVILSNRSAVQAFGRESMQYRMYIGPVIFALAPVLNTVVSMIWHPNPTEGALHFGIKDLPGWKMWVGILMTGAGAALVLYSKEEAEVSHKAPPRPVVAPAETGIKSSNDPQ